MRPLWSLLPALTLVAASLGRAQGVPTQGAPAQPAQPAQPVAIGEAWRIIRPPQSSLVYARDGTLIGEIGREWRTSIAIATLPAYVPQAFIAVEDQRFYQHDGVDVVGIAAAVKDNLLGASRGASTITQQLVGNMHPTLIDRTDKSLGRKLREQAAAREMEKRYSKAQILEAYLNQIHFGRQYYGIESAARYYFGKPASRLTIAEAASLAAMPKGPALYDPITHPDRHRDRRNTVLALMRSQGFLTAAQERAARAEPVRTAPDLVADLQVRYYLDVVRVRLERAKVPVAAGGYRIVTALDPALQRAAVAALRDGIRAVESQKGYRHPTLASRPKGSNDYLQGAVVAMESATGDVRALVGGRDYAESQYNRAVNATRQPGSAFKPIIYARALMDSIAPTELVTDAPITLRVDRTTYSPKNADGAFLGEITLRQALAQSRNPVAVLLWERLGADSIIALAQRMGIDAPIAKFPSSALGASAVRPIDLIAAFTAFANLGASVEPRIILRVDDPSGRQIHSEPVVMNPPAMDSAVAWVTRDLMRDVVESGTGTAVRRTIPATIPVAGKTGTTDANTDVWFIGMVPHLVAGVWLGFDQPKTIASNAVGGAFAAPIFGQMLSRWGGLAPDPWDPPSTVVTAELDRLTGKLAEATTPADRRVVEHFVPGSEPPPLRIDARRLLRIGALLGY